MFLFLFVFQLGRVTDGVQQPYFSLDAYSLQECDSTKMKNLSMAFGLLSFQGSVSIAPWLQSIKDYSI